MATIGGNGSVTDGLVFYYDTGNKIKSFKGEPTENLVNGNPILRGLAKHPDITHTLKAGENFDGSDGVIEISSGGWSAYTSGIGGLAGIQYTTSWFLKKNISSMVILDWGGSHDGNKNKLSFNFDTEVLTVEVNVVGESMGAIKLKNGWWQLWLSSTLVEGPNYYPQISLGNVLYGGIQIEQKPYPTPFTPTSRSATESLIDLTGNSLIDVSSTNFSENNKIFYDGISGYTIINNDFVGSVTQLTTEVWFKKDGQGQDYECVLHKGSATSIGSSDFWSGVQLNDYLTATIGANQSGIGWGAGQTSELVEYGRWYNLVASWDGATVRVYIDAVLKKQYTLTSYGNLTTPTRIGASSNGTTYRFNGEIPIVKIYNRALSPEEVKRNFNAVKSRFNIT